MFTHTLLLVDDSTTIHQEIRSAFADEPIQIVVAVNGHRALDRIEADRPDVVLASTTALGVNGYGLAHYVSQRPSLGNIAVLLLTDTVSPTDTHRMKESGARGFVRHPIEPDIVVARVKEVLMLPGPEISQSDVLGQLSTAFDAIDASMTSHVFGAKARPNEIAITPEALARIVNDAVTQAIAAYEQARSLAPASDSATGSGRRPPVVPPSPGRTKQQQLQRDMGLDDIGFEPAPPAESNVDAGLAAEMGIDDFVFEAPDSTRPIEVSEPREVAPDTFAAPPPETDRRAEESGASVTNVLEPLRDAVVLVGTALADQASRFRSALAERARRRAHGRDEAVPAAVPPPAPAQPDPMPEPPAPPEARPASMTPADAAQSIFFTFKPIPPVPPPIPREPREG